MNISRRKFLTTTLATSSMVAFATIFPAAVMADWPQTAFQAKTVKDAMKALFNHAAITETNKIFITAPTLVKDGNVVPIEVTASLPQVQTITIIADRNPNPLIGQFNFAEETLGFVKTRIKMTADISNIVAIVKAKGELYIARRQIEVIEGGCGCS
jgi:sulfur-oxidizing protein SoxY